MTLETAFRHQKSNLTKRAHSARSTAPASADSSVRRVAEALPQGVWAPCLKGPGEQQMDDEDDERPSMCAPAAEVRVLTFRHFVRVQAAHPTSAGPPSWAQSV